MDLSTIKILVVDDSSTMRMIIRKELKSIGVTFEEAADGQLAWNRLCEQPNDFKVVLSDVNMPNMNGIELLKKIRSDQRFKELPVVMLTSETEESIVKAAHELGITGYLNKPLKTPELVKVLARMMVKAAAL